MSLPDETRHMASAWKADLSIARLALSEDVGRTAAHLAGWSGTQLGQDTIRWKAIAHRHETSFTEFLDPSAMADGVRFSNRRGGYIYRRYQRTDDPILDESFFPVLWSRSGLRTGWIQACCDTGCRTAPRAPA